MVIQDEETKQPDNELVKKSVEKIVKDFQTSLVKALDALGEYSNAEKHVNELVHRANFRFADLKNLEQECTNLLQNCLSLTEIINDELSKQLEDAS